MGYICPEAHCITGDALMNVLLAEQGSGSPLLSLTGKIVQGRVSHNLNGDEALTMRMVMADAERWPLLTYAGSLEARVTAPDGSRYWTGRVEDAGLSDGGVTIKALGYQSALDDVLITCAYRGKQFSEWTPITPDDDADYLPDRWTIDTNNRLYIAPLKDQPYRRAELGGLFVRSPEDAHQHIDWVRFDYEFATNNTKWELRMFSADRDFSSPVNRWTLVGDGATKSGSQSVMLPAEAQLIYFDVYYNNLLAETYAGENGDVYGKITNLEWGVAPDPIYPGDIVRDVLSQVRVYNPDHLSALDGLIYGGPEQEFAVYTDTPAREVVAEQAAYADHWWRVRGRVLQMALRGQWSQEWAVRDVDAGLERTLASLETSARAVWRDARGEVRRTKLSTNAAAVRQAGVDRQGTVGVKTTSEATAESRLAEYMARQPGQFSPRGRMKVRALYSPTGGLAPLWSLYPGDTLILRNLPPWGPADALRRLLVTRTEYDLMTGELTVMPDLLDTSLAAQLGKRTPPPPYNYGDL